MLKKLLQLLFLSSLSYGSPKIGRAKMPYYSYDPDRVIKPYRHELLDRNFEFQEIMMDGFDEGLDLHKRNSTFIFHGYSGLGKSTMITMMAPDHKGIGGQAVKSTGFTRNCTLYEIGQDGTEWIKIIDTPGLNENGEENREMVLKSLDQAIALSKENGPVRQIYYFLKYDRQNEIGNKIKLLTAVYGEQIRDFITFVVSKSDEITVAGKGAEYYHEIIRQVQNSANLINSRGQSPQVLFVSGNTNFELVPNLENQKKRTIGCFIQLAQHMSQCARNGIELDLKPIHNPMKQKRKHYEMEIWNNVREFRDLNRELYRMVIHPRRMRGSVLHALKILRILTTPANEFANYITKVFRIPEKLRRRNKCLENIINLGSEYESFKSLIGHSGGHSSSLRPSIINETFELHEILLAEAFIIDTLRTSLGDPKYFRDIVSFGRSNIKTFFGNIIFELFNFAENSLNPILKQMLNDNDYKMEAPLPRFIKHIIKYFMNGTDHDTLVDVMRDQLSDEIHEQMMRDLVEQNDKSPESLSEFNEILESQKDLAKSVILKYEQNDDLKKWEEEIKSKFKEQLQTLGRLHNFNELFDIFNKYPTWEGQTYFFDDRLINDFYKSYEKVTYDELPHSRQINYFLKTRPTEFMISCKVLPKIAKEEVPKSTVGGSEEMVEFDGQLVSLSDLNHDLDYLDQIEMEQDCEELLQNQSNTNNDNSNNPEEYQDQITDDNYSNDDTSNYSNDDSSQPELSINNQLQNISSSSIHNHQQMGTSGASTVLVNYITFNFIYIALLFFLY